MHMSVNWPRPNSLTYNGDKITQERRFYALRWPSIILIETLEAYFILFVFWFPQSVLEKREILSVGTMLVSECAAGHKSPGTGALPVHLVHALLHAYDSLEQI